VRRDATLKTLCILESLLLETMAAIRQTYDGRKFGCRTAGERFEAARYIW
jgi:hypothetical protein